MLRDSKTGRTIPRCPAAEDSGASSVPRQVPGGKGSSHQAVVSRYNDTFTLAADRDSQGEYRNMTLLSGPSGMEVAREGGSCDQPGGRGLVTVSSWVSAARI